MSLLDLIKGDDTYKVIVTNRGRAGMLCRIVDLVKGKTIAYDIVNTLTELQSFIKLYIK